jgi:P pilus assembly chaperone PapD
MKKIFAFVLALAAPVSAAQAEISLSQLVVELQAGKHDRQDVEVANTGPDPAYVEVDPREILAAGTPAETARTDPDPDKLGLLISPTRLILQPGQRRLVRIATLAAAAPGERVYRVTVKPVVGKLSAAQSGLKLLVGYDMLVLVRPAVLTPSVAVTRTGNSLTITNTGNVSVELSEGRQCDAANRCTALPDKRVYAGASWTQPLKSAAPVDYTVDSPGKSEHRRF